jgi:hypothetical protein
MADTQQPNQDNTMTEEAQATQEAQAVAEPFVPHDPPATELPAAEWPEIGQVSTSSDTSNLEVAQATAAEGPAMQYALIKGGAVQNVIVASAEFAKLIAPEWDHIEAIDTLHEQGLGVAIGWGFENGEFVKPPEPPKPEPLPPVRDIHAGALYLRFTFAERSAILLAGTINPAADAQTQQLQAQVATLRSDLMSARMISLDSPGLATGCKLLAGLKILTGDWEQRILKAPVTQEEQAFGR